MRISSQVFLEPAQPGTVRQAQHYALPADPWFPHPFTMHLWLLVCLLCFLSGRNRPGLSRPFEPSKPKNAASTSTLSGHELLAIGEIHDHQHHFPETLTYYQLALSRFREKNSSGGIATALVKIARVYEAQGKLLDAYGSLQEAVPIVARLPDRAAHAGALLVMGRVTVRLGQRDEARDSLSQAVTLFQARQRFTRMERSAGLS